MNKFTPEESKRFFRNAIINEWLAYKKSSGFIELELGLIDTREYMQREILK